jgi:hypothetical protein
VSRQDLHIEFGAGQRQWRLQGLGWLVPALALLAFGTWQVGNTLQARLDERQVAERQTKAAKSAAARLAAAVDPQAEVRNAATDRLAARLNRPWAGLLEVFESADSQKVAVLAVQPNLQTGLVQVVIEAASLDDAVDYFQTLRGDARLNAVTLVSHERQDKTPGSPVRLQLTANWRAQ